MKLVANDCKLHSALQFQNSFSTNTSIYYAFAAKSTSFEDDNDPPVIEDIVQTTVYDVYDQMLFGKRILSDDVRLMLPKIPHTNTVFSRYDHAADLTDSSFYCTVLDAGTYHVYKCLDNNNGAVANASYPPANTDPTNQSFFTGDGYQWKYMYTANASIATKFSTSSFIPFVENANVTSNAVSGAIDVIAISSFGTARYISTDSGTLSEVSVGGNNYIVRLGSTASATNDIYNNSCIFLATGTGAGQQRKIVEYSALSKTVVLDDPFDVTPVANNTTYDIVPNVVIFGDGTGAQARALVNSSTQRVYGVVVTEAGSGYTRATAEVQGNTGVVTLSAEEMVSLRVILPPAGGHGSDVPSELGMHHVGMSVKFDSSLADGRVLDKNDFRVMGIVKDPLLRNVFLTIDTTPTLTFADNEVITQAVTGATGTVVERYDGNNTLELTNVLGIFDNANTHTISGTVDANTANVVSVGGPGLYLDQTLRLTCTNLGSNPNTFIEDEYVYQPGRESGTGANGVFYHTSNSSPSNSTVIRLTETSGVFNTSDVSTEWLLQGNSSGAQANITSIQYPDIVYGTGKVLYIQNSTAISKNTSQTETLKVIVEF